MVPEETELFQKYLDARFKSIDISIESLSTLVSQHFSLNEKAIAKAEEAMTIRLENMNEFRAQINSERISYVTRDFLERNEKVMDARLKQLESAGAFSAGKMWMVMAIFAAIPTILALMALFRG